MHATTIVAAVTLVLTTLTGGRASSAQTTTGTAAPQTAASEQTGVATFAAGCFWCVEEAFDKVDGVRTTTSGYTGGQRPNPTYEEVSSGTTGHTEAVQVAYDPSRVSYRTLLQTFWHNVDPIDGAGQFCDRGRQYRPAIFVHSEEQREEAEESRREVAAQLGRAVAVEIVPAPDFYAAEAYHQDYYTKNPLRYRFYKWSCGRAQRLQEIWGESH
jgi:peptide-methionine (S)-S-oxide reductase